MLMETYISITKSLIDYVSITSDEISNRDQVLYILGGLGSDYACIIPTITQKKKVSSLSDLFSSLRIQENKI